MTLSLRSPLSLLALVALLFTLVACNPSEGDVVEEGDTSNEFVGSISDLMKDGKDITCTFTRNDEAGDMEGTVYVARNGNMRGDFTMQTAQFGEITMHTIRDGDYGYTWGFPSETEGTKIKLDATGVPVDSDDSDAGIDDPMEYTCKSWNVDSSMFEVPSDVEFQDLSAQMQQIIEGQQQVNSLQCESCNQLQPGQGREQCLEALGC